MKRIFCHYSVAKIFSKTGKADETAIDNKLKYKKPVIVAEYSRLKDEVNKIAFTLAGENIKGTFIRDSLSTWESILIRMEN